jgi:hypothetical protein
MVAHGGQLEQPEELGSQFPCPPLLARQGLAAQPSVFGKEALLEIVGSLQCRVALRRSRLDKLTCAPQGCKHFLGRLICMKISAMPKVAMRRISTGKSRGPRKGSRPIRKAPTSPTVSEEKASAVKPIAGRCVRLRPVIAQCSLCGSPADEVHLVGDRRARCEQCCPVCNHAQPPAQAGVTRPRAGYSSPRFAEV